MSQRRGKPALSSDDKIYYGTRIGCGALIGGVAVFFAGRRWIWSKSPETVLLLVALAMVLGALISVQSGRKPPSF